MAGQVVVTWRRVDTEGWDIFAVTAGKAGRPEKKRKEKPAARLTG